MNWRNSCGFCQAKLCQKLATLLNAKLWQNCTSVAEPKQQLRYCPGTIPFNVTERRYQTKPC